MLEDGEISDSSIENGHSIDLPSSTTHPKFAPNHRPTKRSSAVTKDPEKSLFEVFTMDVEPDSASMNSVKPTVQAKKRKPFTGWTEQLLEEKQSYPSKPSRPNRSTKKVVIIDPKQQEYEAAKPQQQPVRKGAVFINHRRLEKRQLGEYEIDSPLKEEPKLTRDQSQVMEKFARNIAASLKEKRHDIVRKIVDACGIQKTSELCTEAQLIYNTIGMLTIDGKPRSLGGCFFQLVKTKGDLSELQKKEIFYEPTTQLSLRKKQVRNAKKRLKKQLKTKTQLEKLFADMKLSIAVRIA